jgi:hypothetical protein
MESGGTHAPRTALAAHNEALSERALSLHPTKGHRRTIHKRLRAGMRITHILQARTMRRVSETAGINSKYPPPALAFADAILARNP